MSKALSGVVTSVSDYQKYAEEKLAFDSYNYYIQGSDDEITLRNNVEAFRNIYLTPRVLIDMTNVSMKTRILGQ